MNTAAKKKFHGATTFFMPDDLPGMQSILESP
jgi:hypothetical protein